MQIGVMFDVDRPFDDVLAQVHHLAETGIEAAWTSQIFSYDALTLLAVIGREVPGIALGTAVVPTYPRHPVMMAGQALTVQAATGGRLHLGIGLSHQVVIENVFGMSFERPARHMREYLSVLVPLLAGEPAAFAGETIRSTTFGPLGVRAEAPPVLVAALGETMLRLAGRMASGTITWMTGPQTVASHIIPTITEAAAEAGRPAPPPPSREAWRETVLRHVAMQIEHRARQHPAQPLEETERLSVKELRKHLLWYTRGRRGGVAFRREAVRLVTAADVSALIDLHFPPDQPFEVDAGFHPADEAGEDP